MNTAYYVVSKNRIIDVILDNEMAAEITLDFLKKRSEHTNAIIIKKAYYGSRSEDGADIVTTITLNHLPFLTIVNNENIAEFFIDKYTKEDKYDVEMCLI